MAAQAEITDDQASPTAGKRLATLLESNCLMPAQQLEYQYEFCEYEPRGCRMRAIPHCSLLYDSRRFIVCRLRPCFSLERMGIPQDNSQHGRWYFVELHGYF